MPIDERQPIRLDMFQEIVRIYWPSDGTEPPVSLDDYVAIFTRISSVGTDVVPTPTAPTRSVSDTTYEQYAIERWLSSIEFATHRADNRPLQSPYCRSDGVGLTAGADNSSIYIHNTTNGWRADDLVNADITGVPIVLETVTFGDWQRQWDTDGGVVNGFETLTPGDASSGLSVPTRLFPFPSTLPPFDLALSQNFKQFVRILDGAGEMTDFTGVRGIANDWASLIASENQTGLEYTLNLSTVSVVINGFTYNAVSAAYHGNSRTSGVMWVLCKRSDL
jgi:hypothetical protein